MMTKTFLRRHLYQFPNKSSTVTRPISRTLRLGCTGQDCRGLASQTCRGDQPVVGLLVSQSRSKHYWHFNVLSTRSRTRLPTKKLPNSKGKRKDWNAVATFWPPFQQPINKHHFDCLLSPSKTRPPNSRGNPLEWNLLVVA
jgi:hypothetical protein